MKLRIFDLQTVLVEMGRLLCYSFTLQTDREGMAVPEVLVIHSLAEFSFDDVSLVFHLLPLSFNISQECLYKIDVSVVIVLVHYILNHLYYTGDIRAYF